MSIVTKSAKADADANTLMYLPGVPLIAAETLPAVSACTINASGKAILAQDGGTFVGFNVNEVRVGEPVTLFGVGAVFEYAEALTPNSLLYVALAADKGKLNDAAPTVDSVPVAHALDARHIRVVRSV